MDRALGERQDGERPEGLAGATLNHAILSTQQNGLFTGVLFYLPIASTTLPGVYRGSAQFRVRTGQTFSSSARRRGGVLG